MENNKIILLSLQVMIISFILILGTYFSFEKFKNRQKLNYKFDLKRYSLLSITWAVGISLLVSLYFSFNKKEVKIVLPKEPLSLKMGCGCGSQEKLKGFPVL
jgi:hypothetical protein